MPDVVAVNNQPCVIQSAALPPHSPPKASHAEDASQLTTLNGQIIGLDGQPLTLWGINWFGFEDGTTMVDGLWAGGFPMERVLPCTVTCLTGCLENSTHHLMKAVSHCG